MNSPFKIIAESTSAPASITERFGQTMKHAGVAVSVTTFTDVIAFLVGRSECKLANYSLKNWSRIFDKLFVVKVF